MSPNRLFASIDAQYENYGDLLIRRLLLAEFSQHQKVVLDSGAPSWWAPAVLEGESARLQPSVQWLFHVLGARKGDVLALSPGAFPLSRKQIPREAVQLLLALWLWVRGARVARFQRSIPSQSSRAARLLHSLACRASEICLWRDDASAKLVGVGTVAPDMALLWRPDTPSCSDKRSLVISLRGDRREQLSAGDLGSLADLALGLDLEIVCVSQVERDNAQADYLASVLPTKQTFTWHPEESIRREVQLLEIYGESSIVVSDRLHVLLIGAISGAVPVCVKPRDNPKITGAFAAAGIHLLDHAELLAAVQSSADLAAYRARTAEQIDSASTQLKLEMERVKLDLAEGSGFA